ncbi:MAG: RdgB/HAM1 family non-canonical purine NTP pyrophosphatase [Chloroflexota bacterium]
MKKLLIATGNSGKVKEFAEMMDSLQVEWLGQKDTGYDLDVEETGQTFTENAILKATQWGKLAGYITLADDSGLEVDALNGEPGLYTARYGGPGLTHQQRYKLLLENLKDIPESERMAQFRCVIAVANGDGEVLTTAEGVCPGRITFEPRGTNGFGYDPVFMPNGWGGKTMAELEPGQKHPISHRGQAIKALEPFLTSLISRTS